MSSSREFVLVLSVALTMLLLGGGGTYLYLSSTHQARLAAKETGGDDSGTQGPKRQLQSVRVAPAIWDTISTIRDFPGHLQPVRDATISSEVSGLIRSIPIEVGSTLQGGETLMVQIDRTWLELATRQNAAEIGSLKAELTHQQAELERIEPLAASRAVSMSDLSLQQSKVEQLQQDLLRLEANGDEIREKLKRTTILAPFDGYVVERVADLGELVSPGSSVAKIVSMGEIDAIVEINEMFIDRIKIGDTFPVLIDQLGEQLDGKVHKIVPYTQSNARSYPVLFRLDDQNGKFKGGMSMRVFIPITDPIEGIVVPKDAVLTKPDGSNVWVLTDPPPTESPAPEATASAETSTTKETANSQNGQVANGQTRNGQAPERHFSAKPVAVTILSYDNDRYAVIPQTKLGQELLKPGVMTVIEGAERLTPDQQVHVAEINPEIEQLLPPRSGHTEVPPRIPGT